MKILHTRFLAMTVLLISATAQASGGGGEVLTASNPKWKNECGACHIAYPARLLPASAWKTVMAGLDKHFGTDASIDKASATEIQAFLEKNASQRKFEATPRPLLRITETRWFQNAHDEVSAGTWKNPKVKGPANCAACHTRADTGDFNEHNIRIPR